MPAAPAQHFAILGGGITGLAAAYRLTRHGHRVKIFERTARLGGVIRTERTTDGWLIDAGPNSFQEQGPEITAFVRELGLASERVEASPLAKNRYVAKRGVLLPLPLSPPALLKSPLFSAADKFRVLTEFLHRRRSRTTDVSVAAFMRSHFGQHIVDYAVQPFVSGVYAGDAEKLSARYAFPRLWEMERQHGSLLRAQIAAAKERRAKGETAAPKIISFRNGLQTLTDAIAGSLPGESIALNCRVESLVPGASWQVICHDPTGVRTLSFDKVIAALPAGSLARLAIGSLAEKPLVTLNGIPRPPVASLFLGFKREQVKHPLDGFGALVPVVEKRATLGIIFSSTLFPGRAPAGHVAMTILAGGTMHPGLELASPELMWSAVRRDLSDLLGVSGEPTFIRHQFWPHAIPQYILGYDAYRDSMAACERKHPGFYIGGQVRDGISLPQCILSGFRLAERAALP